MPFVFWDGNHHAMIRLGNLVGDIVEGEFLIDGVAMDAAQRRHHHRQYVVSDEGQTKAEEGRLGIAQGVNFRGSYWIPGSSWANFCVTACFCRLSTRVVTEVVALGKAV